MGMYLACPFVVIRIENECREVLLGRQPHNKGKPYPGFWDLPGGKLEPNETLEECCVRELGEETGFKATSMSLFGGYHHSEDQYVEGFKGKEPGVAYCFEVTVEGEFRPDELEEMHWVSVKELKTLKLTPMAKHFLHDRLPEGE